MTRTVTTNDTAELLELLTEAKRLGHHARTLARGKGNAEFIVTIDEGPAQPELISEAKGSSEPAGLVRVPSARVSPRESTP